MENPLYKTDDLVVPPFYEISISPHGPFEILAIAVKWFTLHWICLKKYDKMPFAPSPNHHRYRWDSNHFQMGGVFLFQQTLQRSVLDLWHRNDLPGILCGFGSPAERVLKGRRAEFRSDKVSWMLWQCLFMAKSDDLVLWEVVLARAFASFALHPSEALGCLITQLHDTMAAFMITKSVVLILRRAWCFRSRPHLIPDVFFKPFSCMVSTLPRSTKIYHGTCKATGSHLIWLAPWPVSTVSSGTIGADPHFTRHRLLSWYFTSSSCTLKMASFSLPFRRARGINRNGQSLAGQFPIKPGLNGDHAAGTKSSPKNLQAVGLQSPGLITSGYAIAGVIWDLRMKDSMYLARWFLQINQCLFTANQHLLIGKPPLWNPMRTFLVMK